MLFNIHWQVFFDCNYNCSYCKQRVMARNYETKKERYERLLKQAPQIKSLIDNLEPEYDKVTLSLIGGEISLLSVEEIKNIFVNLLTDRVSKVSIISNLSASADWYTNIFYYLKQRNVALFLIASFHEEYADISTFFNKAEQINKVIKEASQSSKKKPKSMFRVTTVITKDNKETFGSLFISNAVAKNLSYQFNYDQFEKWAESEKYQELQGNLHSCKWVNKKETEDIFGYTCSASVYCVNISSDGRINGNVSCSDCFIGVLGITKKIVHKEIVCQKHHCNMCGKVRLKRPDGSLFVTNMLEGEL